MVVKRSALVSRTQRKKLEFNPSYGYGAMSKNASKCTMLAHLVHFRILLLIAPTRIQFLSSWYQGASIN